MNSAQRAAIWTTTYPEQVKEGQRERKDREQYWGELDRERERLAYLKEELKKRGPEDFKHREGYFEGTAEDYIERCTKSWHEGVEKRHAYEKRALTARRLLDDLGGATHWKDCKLDWENYDDQP